MSRQKSSGPISGAYITETYTSVQAASQTNALVGIFTCPFTHFRPSRIVFRVTGTNLTLTAFLVRKLTGDADAAVAATDTQLLSADGGTLAANTHVAIEAQGTTPTFVQTPVATNDTSSARNADSGIVQQTRDLIKGDQIGFFVTTDATAGNRTIWVDFCGYALGHVVKGVSPSDTLALLQYD
jgi:hypothetical protein